MTLGAHELKPSPGATHSQKRVGRGNGSGHGTYAGKGLKGQKSRSGKPLRATFEGGQSSLMQGPTLRGFNNKWRIPFQPVNVAALNRFDDGDVVTPESLRTAGILRHLRDPLKILGEGELSRRLDIHTHAVSAPARTVIEAAGGSITLLAIPGKKAKEPASTTVEAEA